MQISKVLILLCVVALSCTHKADEKGFVVKGKLQPRTGKMIYLEKVPAALIQPSVEDSSVISADGSFRLKAAAGEAVIFNLRIDQSRYPLLSLVNDTTQVELDIRMRPDDSQFPENYTVTGSRGSQELKDFVTGFNNRLIEIHGSMLQSDSLYNSGASDSMLALHADRQAQLATSLQQFSYDAIDRSNNPALAIFELGYYESTAGGTNYGLARMDADKLKSVMNSITTRYPDHKVAAAVKANIDKSLQAQTGKASWVGKEAPDFTLPDATGKEVSLHSFRGKYVLVDFWASWCMPCRQENPNVVSAFQRFKDRNFTVLGVSLDHPGQRDKWLKAVMDDKLAWTQVSDLQYWNSLVVKLYGLEGIPYNVLVDPKGIVVAEGLRGSQLGLKLAELLR